MKYDGAANVTKLARPDEPEDWSLTPIIEEIKSTYRNVYRLRAPIPVHLAQAKCYAWFYCLQTGCTKVRVLMTYVNIATNETRYFYEKCTASDLKEWFDKLMKAYIPWMDYQYDWSAIRRDAILRNEFPYPYRKGQRELCNQVYATIEEGKKLFLQAPTGSGKTLATIFPSVQAIGEGKANRLFYLTSRTTLRALAEDAFSVMREHSNLRFKTVTLTAKEKICFTEKHECNPDDCPFAKGHHDRVNTALYDLITHEEVFTRDKVEQYARAHMVCPFELSLDASLFADGIIGDYNYLFDPFVYLRRFFGEGHPADSIFLVDEAHNLVDRGRAMYSTELSEQDLLTLRKKIENDPALDEVVTQIDKVHEALMRLSLERYKATATQNAGEFQTEDEVAQTEALLHAAGFDTEARDNALLTGPGVWIEAPTGSFILIEDIESLYDAIQKLNKAIASYLDTRRKRLPHRRQVLDLYLILFRFCTLYDRMDRRYVLYGTRESQRGFILHLFCIDPSKDLAGQMEAGVATVLFSATLLPIEYYKRLLGGNDDDFETYATSDFDPDRCLRLVFRDVTGRYKSRTENMFRAIAEAIRSVVRAKRGNYMVFFPSYMILDKVSQFMFTDEEEGDGGEADMLLLVQKRGMREEERANFLENFTSSRKESGKAKTLVGFCVMGGIFSEGIDLSGESLIGAMVVSTGLPQISTERNLLKNWFDINGENAADGTGESGFRMAYTYPGFCRVLQAAGRVIRTAEDVGVVALLDYRFAAAPYNRLFPQEWKGTVTCRTETVRPMLEAFWKKWDRDI